MKKRLENPEQVKALALRLGGVASISGQVFNSNRMRLDPASKKPAPAPPKAPAEPPKAEAEPKAPVIAPTISVTLDAAPIAAALAARDAGLADAINRVAESREGTLKLTVTEWTPGGRIKTVIIAKQ